ncbi:MAG: hypothetical protein HN867_14225 [Deltaproteobacteria bacterium]|nr:hypothetical protein [Deltaproteobacteria bacterium]MBT7204620.1 hypothetical protein [Deltaproteobacteria bacterium]
MFGQIIVRLANGELPSDVARVAIDGRKWVTSRLLSRDVQRTGTAASDCQQGQPSGGTPEGPKG